MSDTPEELDRHAMKMAKKKAARDKIMATKTTQDKSRDMEMAAAAWEKAKELIRNPDNKMVLLDEINIALRYDYIDVNEVVAFLRDEKPEMTPLTQH